MTPIPILDRLSGLAGRYPVWLCDIWGVLHNGEVAYPEASEALCEFRKAGGTVILITNAPRPLDDVERQITSLGVAPAAYDSIVTSGDVTRALIDQVAGRGVYHLGPERDRSLFEGLAVRLVGLETATAVVCSGLFDDLVETPDDYSELLAAMRAKSLPMICANPDIIVERGSSLSYCAGALGAEYEKMGGKVAYAGKPKAPIYAAALSRVALLRGAPPNLHDVLAIGDGLKTDILGAHDFGIDALFVASGIHLDAGVGLTETSLRKLFENHPSRPVAAIERLTW